MTAIVLDAVDVLGVNEQGSNIPFYDTDFDKARKYLRLNILNKNKNGTFEKESKQFTSALGYKWPSKLGDMLTDYIAHARVIKLELNKENFSTWKDYLLSRGFTLWQVIEFYRAFSEEVRAGTISKNIYRPWTYIADGNIYSVIVKYGLFAVAIYAFASSIGRGITQKVVQK